MDGDPLEIVKDDDFAVVLRQPEFADAWEFQARLDGCVNFGQYDSQHADGEAPHTWSEEPPWTHACDLDLMIAMLQQVKRVRDDRVKARDLRDGR